MWGAYRWAARVLLLVMLVPAFGPMAMACAARPETMHCTRQPTSGQAGSGQARSGQTAQPAMQCHHAMAQSKPPQSEESSAFRATNDGNCCQNHCCCGASTSEWARPASSLPSFISLAIEPSRPSQDALLPSSDIRRQDSARAPPRS